MNNFPHIKLKLYIYSLEFFHLVHTCAGKNMYEVLSVPWWTPEVYSSVWKCNVADTMSPFYHLLWALHQFAPGWGLHIEESPKGIVLEVPITSMQLNFTCRTFVYMTTYLFSFLTFNSTQNILDQFFTRWALANYTHMETLPISRVCLGANPSSLWVSVCFCERCYNIYFMQICMDILDHPWLLFTWYMVLQNILLELLCFLMFINFHSLIRGLLPPSSLACGPLKLETNTWKVNCQGVSDAMYLVRVFGFGVACLGILGGSRKSPRPLRYLESFWMQLFHSTLYLIYLIQTGPPWNTYHNSVKKKQTHQLIFSFVKGSGSQKIHHLMSPPYMAYVVFS